MRVLRLIAAAALGLTLTPTPPAQAVDVAAGTVLLRSDFDSWDSRWTIQGDKNVTWVAGGQLALGIDRNPDGTLRQARLHATPVFTYGTLQARMRFTGPKGAHSAFWAQSTGGYCDGCTEIDISEHLGAPRIWENLYWCPCAKTATGANIYQEVRDSTDLDPAVWHIYKVDWTAAGYTLSVDGVVQNTWTVGLSNKPHFMILSYLISAWEQPNLDLDHLGRYRLYVDWVEAKANADTTMP